MLFKLAVNNYWFCFASESILIDNEIFRLYFNTGSIFIDTS